MNVLGVNMGDACNVTMQRVKQGLDRLHTQRHNMQQALNSLAGTPLHTLAMLWMWPPCEFTDVNCWTDVMLCLQTSWRRRMG